MSDNGVGSVTASDASWLAERLKIAAADVLASFPVAGGVITVSNRQGVIAETCFGSADLERQRPANAQLTYEIGSISKMFAGLVCVQLEHEGQLRLDELVSDALPWTAGTIVREDATLLDLLNHTSGAIAGGDALPDDVGELWLARAARPSMVHPPRFHYSNIGFQLLGEIVLARTGQRMVELERARVLEPLGMVHAVAEVTHADRSRMALGYWPARTDQPWVPGAPLATAPWFELDSVSGNIAATASDMVRLTSALLGASDGDPLLDETGAPVLTNETFERLTSTLGPGGEPFDDYRGLLEVQESRYGLGINVARIGGNVCLTHGGGMVGYSTFMLVDCTAGFAVTVLTSANGDCLGAHLLARVAHSDLVRRLRGEADPSAISLASLVTTSSDCELPFAAQCRGTFFSARDGATLSVAAHGPDEAVTVTHEGAVGHLYRLASGRYVSDHPGLRRFLLDAVLDESGAGWTYGDVVFRGTMTSRTVEVSTHPMVGRYRSYSPWYPEFRIIERLDRLYLVAPGGTEAPAADEELVELASGTYRIGRDEWLPERLVAGAEHGGRVVALSRDGCLYARTALF